jgi:DNA-binding MarR family transcriptional regulator
MTDVNPAGGASAISPLYLRDEELKQGVDLLFFAMQNVWMQGLPELNAAGLGRAHGRALHFIARQPGLTVAELLALLRITKQSLNRVLNDLLAAGYVERRPSPSDRRMRQLRLTHKGEALEAALWEAQRPALVRAFREAGPEAVMGFRRVLSGLGPVERRKRAMS